MNRYVEDFAELLNNYNNKQELNRIKALCSKLNYLSDERITVADVGCGTGRSINLIRKVWPKADIYAIDIDSEKIAYAKENNRWDDITFIRRNARDYFNLEPNIEQFDIVLFSWSLFEMIDIEKDLDRDFSLFVMNVRKHIKKGGLIIVLQPTKGGTFEQLLSRFMPDSDEYYLLTHNQLINNGFRGPDTVFPTDDDEQAIWSEFNCTYEELYRGVKAVIYLETNNEINRREFDKITGEFLEEHQISKPGRISLSDCVNMYYVMNK